MTRRNDKRDKLIESADTLFHQQGLSNTTLANIATLSGVPLGNVYYYFKSKDSIILAVLDRRRRFLQNLFNDLNNDPDIKGRLFKLIEHFSSLCDETAKYGDALGGLCQELGKVGGNLTETSSALMNDLIKWCENQFKALGKSSEISEKLALNLVATLQGINLLTLTFNDTNYIVRQERFLKEWLNTELTIQEGAYAF